MMDLGSGVSGKTSPGVILDQILPSLQGISTWSELEWLNINSGLWPRMSSVHGPCLPSDTGHKAVRNMKHDSA